MARLNAVYRVISGQQWIAVLLRYSIPGKFRNGVEAVVLGLLPDDRHPVTQERYASMWTRMSKTSTVLLKEIDLDLT